MTRTGLEPDTTYSFKVAAAVKSKNAYKTGDLSAEVTVTTLAKKNTKKTMTKVNMSERDMIGTWVYYDSANISLDSGETYDPKVKQSDSSIDLLQITVIDSSCCFMCFDQDHSGTGVDSVADNASMKSYKLRADDILYDYRAYKCGSDYYLFIEGTTTIDKKAGKETQKCSLIYKLIPPPKMTAATSAKNAEGKWIMTDMISSVKPAIIEKVGNYDPRYPIYGKLAGADMMFTVKNSKATLYFSGEELGSDIDVTNTNIGALKYKIYKMNSKYYMFIYSPDPDGDYIIVLEKR